MLCFDSSCQYLYYTDKCENMSGNSENTYVNTSTPTIEMTKHEYVVIQWIKA